MDFEQICVKVVGIARSAGMFIKQESIHFNHSQIEYKGLNDLVSYVDKKAEEQIVSELYKILPDAGFIAEEGTSTKKSSYLNWIIDPLDGTTNFIHGVPTYAVSIALQHNEELVIGVVYEINRDECFYAFKRGGAILNGQPIRVSKTPSLSQSLIATGFPYYDFTRQQSYMELFTEVMKKCHGLRRIGAASVDMVYVACGRFDGYFEYNLKSWDIAAGIVIVKEAGGRCFDFNGGQKILESGDIVATNGLIFEDLNAIIHQFFAKNV